MIDCTFEVNEDDIFVQVFGLEKRGRARGYEVGVTPSKLFGSSSKVKNLECRLNEFEKYLHEF